MGFSLGPVCWGQVEKPHWSESNRPETLPAYRSFSKTHFLDSGGGFIRSEYIQRTNDKKPIRFYRHERMIDFTLGHKSRLVLINDWFAVDANQVLISDLETCRVRRIDEKAFEHYQKRFPEWKGTEPLKSGYLIPAAVAFSPDDHEVLIHIDLDSWVLGPAKDKWYRKHPDRSYVVDSTEGNILKIYQTKAVPVIWWVENND